MHRTTAVAAALLAEGRLQGTVTVVELGLTAGLTGVRKQ